MVEIKIVRKPGFDINPKDDVVNSIFRQLEHNNGHCPTLKPDRNGHDYCPCSAYLQHNECYCGLYTLVEIWKDVKGFENYYEVSTFGRVRSKARTITRSDNVTMTFDEKILAQYSNKKRRGYCYVYLRIAGKKYAKFVHRLVAEAFIPNPNNLPQINHKDECTTNNRLDNLEWCTGYYNANYGTRNKKMCLNNRQRKVVLELDNNNNIINEYPSVKNASKHFHINTSTINDICNGITHPRVKLNLKFKD